MSYKFVKNLGKNYSSRSKYGYGSKITGSTIHHWGSNGQKHANVVSWLRGYTGNSGSSAHYVVSDGLVTQLVEDSNASWHGGNNKAHGTTIGIECRPEMSAGDWATLVELCVNLERKHGSMKYYGHKDWKNTACPGDYYSRLGELVKAVNAYKKSGKVPSTTGGGSSTGSSGGSSKTYQTVSYGTTLGKWDKGDPVKDWQDFLIDQGYKLPDGADGYFGDDTDKATRSYQGKVGLKADGLVGDDTWARAKKDGLKTTRKPAKSSGGSSKSSAPGKAKPFPWGKDHYIGPKDGPDRSHSGYYNGDDKHIKALVDQLVDRGWNAKKGGTYLTKYGNDGRYGAELEALIRAFQRDQKLTVDGLAGKSTWDAAFKNPVT